MFGEARAGTGGKGGGAGVGQTDITENITFQQLRWRPLIIHVERPLSDLFRRGFTLIVQYHSRRFCHIYMYVEILGFC